MADGKQVAAESQVLPGEAKRCVLCRCWRVTNRHGFPVCVYHQAHGEDDPPCPTCRHPR